MNGLDVLLPFCGICLCNFSYRWGSPVYLPMWFACRKLLFLLVYMYCCRHLFSAEIYWQIIIATCVHLRFKIYGFIFPIISSKIYVCMRMCLELHTLEKRGLCILFFVSLFQVLIML